MLTNSQHPCYIQMCEYSCIQISNTQKSLIGYTWGRSWSDNLNWTNIVIRWGSKVTLHNDNEQNNDAVRWRNHERKN